MSNNEKDKVFENFTEADKLEWIKTLEEIDDMPRGHGLREKMSMRIKENPLVPIGMLATTIALSFGLNAMRKGNKRKSQLMMRARILAQGFTVAAILGGIVVAANTKPPSNT